MEQFEKEGSQSGVSQRMETQLLEWAAATARCRLASARCRLASVYLSPSFSPSALIAAQYDRVSPPLTLSVVPNFLLSLFVHPYVSVYCHVFS